MSAHSTDTPPRSETVTFFSDGVEIVGDLFSPGNSPVDAALPAVVLCHGWGMRRGTMLESMGRELAASGFVALTFDYRGFGDSGGVPGRLRPSEQVADAHAAVTYVRTRTEVDPGRIALFGIGFGGATAVEAAAEDPRVIAVVSVASFSDGETYLRSLRRHWEWLAFLKRLEADRVRRTLVGESELVDPNEIFLRDPDAAAHEDHLRDTAPWRAAWKIDLAAADAILRFKPVEVVARIAPRACMFIGVEQDGFTPIDEAFACYEQARDPKRLLVLGGDLQHHDVYAPDYWHKVMHQIVDFLRDPKRPITEPEYLFL